MHTVYSKSKTASLLILFAALVLHTPRLLAVHSLVGPAFTSPDHVEQLPADWQSKPINRSEWPEDTDIAVTLDQHLYPALLPLIKEFASANDLRIAVQEGTCGISAGKLLDREADVGGFCCPAGETDRLPGLQYHTLGIAALALITHPDNPIESVTLGQARRLFEGHTTTWDALGVESGGLHDGVIRPVGRLHCKSRPGHWRLLLSDEDQFSPRLREVSTIPDMISVVARNGGAIGYETLWMLEKHRDSSKVKTIAIDGVKPEDRDALASGEYPLYRTYNITTWSRDSKARNEQAERLVAHIKENFHRVDPKYGFVPSSRLKSEGWRFTEQELSGAPQ